MPAGTDQFTSYHIHTFTTSSVTIDLTTHPQGPKIRYGSSSEPAKQLPRMIEVDSSAAGTTIEITLPSGDQKVLTRNASAGRKFEVHVKKILPATSTTSLIVYW
jgi:hypothetical protein